MAGGPVDQVRARLDIVEVVSERVALKKAGKTFKGLCPFHTEKTPSFIVFPDTGRWHCFGCGAGGDVFGFVMQSQNLGFAEALQVLAGRAGVELHHERRPEKADGTEERLYAVNEGSVAYFQSMLAGPAGARARAYIEGREISPESVEAFQLGYAPDSGAGLAHHLLQEGFKREDILQAAVAGENESGGLYDRFRGRLIFPIRDGNGKLVGFGGRALSAEAQPKYLNTSQTPLFDKGGNLYLLDRAKQEIRRTGQAVIVEGYVDALMAHQHGFKNVVASLGTALTDRQVSQLKRYASELLFALDPDVAGQEATARGLSVAMEALDRVSTPVPTWKGLVEYVYKLKTTIKIIALPKGNDPDDLIRRNPSEWQQLVRDALPVQDFFLARVKARHDLTTAAGKSAAVEEAMGVISEIPDPVQQAHYVQRLAGLVGIEEAFLLQQMRQRKRRGTQREGSSPARRAIEPIADVESYCVALLIKDPSLVGAEPRLKEEDFQDPTHREIFRKLLGCANQDMLVEDVIEKLRDELEEPVRESLEQLVELQARHPIHFEKPLEEAFKSATVSLLLSNLELRRRQVEAMQGSGDEDPGSDGAGDLSMMEKQLTEEVHRLRLLGGFIPLRAIHKEVRHGG